MRNPQEFVIATDLFPLLGADKTAPEWVKIFPYGTWDNPAYDAPWVITKEFGEEIAGNFDGNVLGIDIALDLHHESSRAPGWIKAVEARNDGVWVKVDWTPYGKELVENGEYRYVSPEWHWNWERASDGEKFKNVLSGVGLTNTPFFKELPALVSLGEEVRVVNPGGNTMGENANEQAGTVDDSATPGGPAGGQGSADERAAAGGRPPSNLPPDPLPDREGEQDRQVAGMPVAGADVAELQRQLAENKAALVKTNAALETQTAVTKAMGRREQKATVLAELRGLRHPDDSTRYMAPAIAEQWAEILCDRATEPQKAQEGIEADKQDLRSERQRLLDLILATAKPWPSSGEVGFVADGQSVSPTPQTAEAKSVELDKQAQAKIEKGLSAVEGESDSDKYMRAIQEVLKERPELGSE